MILADVMINGCATSTATDNIPVLIVVTGVGLFLAILLYSDEIVEFFKKVTKR